MVCHVASSGDPGFVLANGSLSLGQSNEGEIRRNLLEADLMDCMVALPGQLFLDYLEHLFEPRDPSFPLIGIDIDMTPGECPRLWYPDSGIAPRHRLGQSRHADVRPAPNALNDRVRARWQLAHSCVHLLDLENEKVDGRPANRLEEGLAVWYQNSRVPEAEYREGLYGATEDLVAPLMGNGGTTESCQPDSQKATTSH